ncbi:SUMF1/EgtB/PvdO family nonheme iron enzyme, partial [candidate division KSB1 bacterium]|nr:SUMF1/EgtB/PvdO family nonheme iron enzyme [candidate division KSB1 bacterium]
MSIIKWMHLSDWHQRAGDFLRMPVRDTLIEDIEKRCDIDSSLAELDFIVFSGDAAYHGLKEEYNQAWGEFFERVLAAAGLEPDRLFIVPGNHDLERPVLEDLASDHLEKLSTFDKVNDYLRNQRKRNLLMTPFQNYNEFYHTYIDRTKVIKEPSFGHNHIFEVNSVRIAILALNSAWLSARSKDAKGKVDDYGKLLIGEPQYYSGLQELEGNDLKITVLHHGFDWLTNEGNLREKSLVRDKLTKNCHFILCGHEHEAQVFVQPQMIGGAAVISAGATYDRRFPENSWPNGYNYVRINPDTGQGRVFLRKYAEKQGWIRDTDTTGDDTPGYSDFEIPALKKNKSSPRPTKPEKSTVEKYLEYTARTCGRLTIKGIQSAEKRYVELNLDDIYVSLEAVEILPHKELEKKAARKKPVPDEQAMRTERPIHLNDVLSVGSNIVILGGAGSGKSTVLRYIAWMMAKAHIEDNAEPVYKKLGLKTPLPIPILIPLHTFAEHHAKNRDSENPETGTLAGCLADYMTRQKGAPDMTLEVFKELIHGDQPCLIMLDGLDEVASDQDRELACETIESMSSWPVSNRFIVTSRPAAFTGQSVIGCDFKQVFVKPLEKPYVETLIKRLYTAARHAERIEDLLSWIENFEKREKERSGQEDKRLIDTPLMVRMAAVVEMSGEKLPEQRAGLYDRFIDAIVRVTYQTDSYVRQALEKLGGNPENQRQWLALLAWHMFTAGEGSRSLDEPQVRKILKAHLEKSLGDKARETVDTFIHVVRTRGGLVDVRYGPPNHWSFTHFPFQEFLTALYLAEFVDDVEAISVELEQSDRVTSPWWREVTLLLFGYFGFRNPIKMEKLVRRMGYLQEKTSAKNTAGVLSAVERVAAAMAEKQGKPVQLDKQVAEKLAGLVGKKQTGAAPLIRAYAGAALARLGDPRTGTELDKNGVPEIYWCEVPAGTFFMGTKSSDIPGLLQKFKGEKSWYEEETPQMERDLPSFLISRFTVTNAQFKAFEEAKDGYRTDKWWTGAGLAWRGNRSRKKESKGVLALCNHPVVEITWFEAAAFCNWLTEKIKTDDIPSFFDNIQDGQLLKAVKEKNFRIRLPAEEEWEKAARGSKPRHFPWGDKFDEKKCNAYPSGIGTTSAVGVFPDGESIYGCRDMAGNVWEWCRTKWCENYHNYDEYRQDRESQDGTSRRVLRGGAF